MRNPHCRQGETRGMPNGYMRMRDRALREATGGSTTDPPTERSEGGRGTVIVTALARLTRVTII